MVHWLPLGLVLMLPILLLVLVLLLALLLASWCVRKHPGHIAMVPTC
jgi:hypothetical protein